MLLHQLLARFRRIAINVVDGLGQRERANRLSGRFSPSRTVRRDHRDMELMRTLISSTVGGGGLGVDVGANVGSVARMFFDASPDQPHILIEPVAHLADSLRSTYPTAEVHQVVCGDASSHVDFSVSIDRPTRSSVHPELAVSGGRIETRRIEQVVLDDLLADRAPSMVKIDVEGAELVVLRGLRRVLSGARPLVVFEHARTPTGVPATSQQVHAELTRSGYRVFDIDGRGPLDEPAFIETVELGNVWTFVGVPLSGSDTD